MAHVLELDFDDDADRAVREIWRTLDSPMIAAGARPHVSLAIADSCDCEPLREALDLGRIHGLAITLDRVDCFRKKDQVVYLAAKKTATLAALHHDVWHHFVLRAENPWPLYAPQVWIPHCTLTYGVDVDDALAKCRDVRLPIEAHVIAIGIVDATPEKVTPIWTEKTDR